MPSKWPILRLAFLAVLFVACGTTSGAPSPVERSAGRTTEALLTPAIDSGAVDPCALLDTPTVRASMSAALETKLSLQCGRVSRLPVVANRGVAREAVAAPGGSNVMVNNPAQDSGGHTTHSETSTVAVGSVVCTAFNDAGEGFGANGFSGFAYSLDGGQTFTDGGAFPNGPSDTNDGDPSLAYSVRDGVFYYAALSTVGLSLWRSTTSCQTFQYVGPIHSGTSDDKEFIAVDNAPTSPHYGRIYVGWTNFALSTDHSQTEYSDDGGVTWSAASSLPGSGSNTQGVWPAVAPNGDVYFAVLNQAGAGGLQDQFIFKSTTGGTTWTKMTNIASSELSPQNPTATSNCGREALTANIRYLPSPQIVISPDANAAAGYVVHAVYSYDSDGSGPDMSNVFYRRSTDGAQTWSAEVQLNDDKTTTDQFFPTIGVSETGMLVASWYDRRLDTTNNTQFDRYMTFSVDRGLTWSPNTRVSDVSSPVAQTDPNFDGLATCYHGDYDQMAVAGSVAHVVWSDDRRILSTGPNPDIYYDKVIIGSAVTVSPGVFEGGGHATGTIYEATPAPTGGSTVALASSAPSLVTVPASVVVPAGSQTVTFPVTTVSTLTRTTVTITATFPDTTSATASVVVLASPTPTALSLAPTSITGGQTSTATVTFSGPAPAGGSIVALSANPSTVATVPSTLAVPAGATTATFAVSTTTQSADTSATVTASLNGISQSATLQVTAPLGNASYDATLKAPRCTSVGAYCDTGPTLVKGRGSMSGGAEPNTPNAVASSCIDGNAGSFHVDESIDRLAISTVDGTPLAPGKQVNVDVTVWEYSTADTLDVFYAPDANAPVWAFEGSVQATASQQLGVIRVSFALPTAASDAGAGSLPVVRAQWRYGGSVADAGTATACSAGSYDDHDDLVFTYQVDTTPPTATITAPANNAYVRGVVSVTVNATDDTGISQVELLVDGSELTFARAKDALNTSSVTTVYTLPLDTTGLTTGSHRIAAQATDLAGNVGTSPSVTVLVDNVAPSVAVTAPAAGAQVSGNVNVTASASDVGSSVAAVDFLVDGAVIGTVTTAPYAIVWNASQAAAGAHTLTARATDVAGNQTVSAGIGVTVLGPPVVSAGPNQTITLPATATLSGTVTPSTSTVAWTKTSGPGTVTFSSPAAVTTSATFSTAGTYVVRLTATNAGLSAYAEATITVNPAVQKPVVSAGPNQTITLPAAATLSGTVTPSTSTVAWTKTSGPGTVTFSSPAAVTTSATFSTAGTYVVRLTATNAGLSAYAEATITVNPAVTLTPCSGLCSNPVNITINGSYSSGNLGTGAVCAQTTSPIHGGNCGNFVSPRTLSVNGTQETCNGSNWSSTPPARNGGYCIQVTSGNQPWAYYTAW